MSRCFLPGTQIEIIHEVERGHIRHVLFDFDGTVSLLREGWQRIMGPVMVEMICGDTPHTPEIEQEVHEVIEETTGIQTILQMERLVEMVRAHGLVPEEMMLDAKGYKEIYNDRLMVPVRERIARLERGELTLEDVTVRGALAFLELLAGKGLDMYVFSGTDRDDVRNEAGKVKAARFFREIWGAVGSIEEYSKEKVIREIMTQHQLRGVQVLAVGDGPVELRNVKAAGGIALGVASDEKKGHGWDEEKRVRLIRAGADILVSDFAEYEALAAYLFPE
ncbi:MAG TPA: HAD hydrolase-like protein [Candidatus Hydrogenedentes bacterium]|nr:HAD hydrolase-like protein [Candidatus Hydrogenedentota bacterium]HPG65725.1 HAD hydrolase-like protein [Candidatus Hydrogenedentota bacterium]